MVKQSIFFLNDKKRKGGRREKEKEGRRERERMEKEKACLLKT